VVSCSDILQAYSFGENSQTSWQNEIARALIHVKIHLSRDVYDTQREYRGERRQTGAERAREILSELCRTPTGPHKKKSVVALLYTYNIIYRTKVL